jgi:hypothetical protein
MLKRYYYCNRISGFISSTDAEIIGKLTLADTFDLGQSQEEAWRYQIEILKKVLKPYEGTICFEYAIPRMGKRDYPPDHVEALRNHSVFSIQG